MYSVQWISTTVTTGRQNQKEGGKTDLLSVWYRINDTRSFIDLVTMKFSLSFIKNDALVAENHHFRGRYALATYREVEQSAQSRGEDSVVKSLVHEEVEHPRHACRKIDGCPRLMHRF